MSDLFQGNDIELRVFIVDESSNLPLDLASVSSASWVLADMSRNVVLSKTLSSGVIKQSDHLVVSLTEADTEILSGLYYHELKIVSGGQASTVLTGNVNFVDTVM